jgi:hypothetical protein
MIAVIGAISSGGMPFPKSISGRLPETVDIFGQGGFEPLSVS